MGQANSSLVDGGFGGSGSARVLGGVRLGVVGHTCGKVVVGGGKNSCVALAGDPHDLGAIADKKKTTDLALVAADCLGITRMFGCGGWEFVVVGITRSAETC